MVNFARSNEHPVVLALPLFEDAHAIQSTLHSVVYHLLDGHISQKTAGLLFYAMQIASSNLKHLKIEASKPDESVVDLPKLSELPEPAPSEESSRINSHTPIRAHFPYTPTVKDEYYDDIMRQARELREHPEGVADGTFSVDLPHDLERAVNALEGDWVMLGMKRFQEEGKKAAAQNAPADDTPSDGKLPPGSIHGCADRRRRNGVRQ